MDAITVFKGRTTKLLVNLPYDASNDIFTSEIRADPNQDGELLAAWSVSFVNDGTDGQLQLVLDDSVTSIVEKSRGWMDIKRVSGGEPLPVWDDVVEVLFKNTVTQ